MRIKYKSHSDISFNIRIDGKRRHIRFESLSTGGSIYITGDPQEIEQLILTIRSKYAYLYQ